ncbi:hypothetical protein [Myxococcus faecalis]|uniref:hypothetical protein n=1 Tax=Myxococcus faecalis TaxID=3115646 RepID=UPI003CE8FE51
MTAPTSAGPVEMSRHPALEELSQALQAAVLQPPSPAEAIAFGAHYRLDLGKLFIAVGKFAKAVVSTGRTFTELSTIDLISAVHDVFYACSSALSAVRQKLQPDEYLVAVVLGGAPQGLTPQGVALACASLRETNGTHFPFWIGLSADLISKANARILETGVDEALAGLENFRLVKCQDDKTYVLTDRHMTIEWNA